MERVGLWVHCFRSLPDYNDLRHQRFFAGCRWIFNPFTEGYEEIRNYLAPRMIILIVIFLFLLFTLYSDFFSLSLSCCSETFNSVFSSYFLTYSLSHTLMHTLGSRYPNYLWRPDSVSGKSSDLDMQTNRQNVRIPRPTVIRSQGFRGTETHHKIWSKRSKTGN